MPAKLQANPMKSTNIVTTYIRIFPTQTSEQPLMRSNERWYEISHALRNGIRFYNQNKIHNFGYFGECALADLAFVDRGHSFMTDTLHSIYHGAFVRL